MPVDISVHLKAHDLVLISNIPKEFHSAQLRNFFSAFLETSGFICFHFRHRPDIARSHKHDTKLPNSSCCFAVVQNRRTNEFIKSYNTKHWVDKEDQLLTKKCIVKKIRTNHARSGSTDDQLLLPDLATLKELRPPTLLPQGNVGTPTSLLLKAIQLCRLPAYMIGRLGLEFPSSRGHGMYSSVPFDYGTRPHSSSRSRDEEEEVATARGIPLSSVYHSPLPPLPPPDDQSQRRDSTTAAADDDDDDGADEVEEWDRHEALHNDITSQERTKPYLYEEEIELKWEKGGSGLVFYTDAQFWDELDGDFDAKTADDWDLDMSVYYEPGAGDKDARDLVQMRYERQLKLGAFEKHTKGIGRRILESQGWKEGQGLGSSSSGISEPIQDIGQDPRDKKGLGFHGDKLSRTFGPYWSRKRKQTVADTEDDEGEVQVRIGTKYDRAEEYDIPEPLLRSHPPTYIRPRRPLLPTPQCYPYPSS